MVREPDSEADIWWATRENGSPNFEMDERTFLLNRERAVDYLNMLDRLYVFDGYAGWDPAVCIEIVPCLVFPAFAATPPTRPGEICGMVYHDVSVRGC